MGPRQSVVACVTFLNCSVVAELTSVARVSVSATAELVRERSPGDGHDQGQGGDVAAVTQRLQKVSRQVQRNVPPPQPAWHRNREGAAASGGASRVRRQEQSGATLSNVVRRAAHAGAAASSASDCSGLADSWTGPSKVNKEAHHAWRALVAPKPLQMGPPKPAFLMMVKEQIAFPQSWETFFRGDDRWGLLVSLSCHGKTDCQVPPFFNPYVRDLGWANASWCKLGRLMLSMIQLSLDDIEVSHVVFLSGDSMPLRPLARIAAELADAPQSRFCVDAEAQRAETWSVMRRDHAQLFAANDHVLQHMMHGVTCQEEDWFYWPLVTRGEQLLDRCVMMADWSDSAKVWNRTAAACQCPALLASPKEKGSCAHPSTFWNLTLAGYSELVGSPSNFWFVRKFPGDGQPGVAWIDGNVPLDIFNARVLPSDPQMSE